MEKIRAEADKLIKDLVIPDWLSWEDFLEKQLSDFNKNDIEDLFQDGMSKLPKVKAIFEKERLVKESELLFIISADYGDLTIEDYVNCWIHYTLYKALYHPVFFLSNWFFDKYKEVIKDNSKLVKESIAFAKRNKKVWYKPVKLEPLVLYYYPQTAKEILKIGITDFFGFYSLKPLLNTAKALKVNCINFKLLFKVNEYIVDAYETCSIVLLDRARYSSFNPSWATVFTKSLLDENGVGIVLDKNFPEDSDLESFKRYSEGNFKKVAENETADKE